MAATLIDVQSHTASGLDAFAGKWSSEAVPASGHVVTATVATMNVSAPIAYVRKHRGIAGGSPEGSS